MITINQLSAEPIYQQIITQYKTLIICDILKSGDRLESVRSLSIRLGINPNTIQKAYTEIENAGICKSEHGKGRFVSDNAKATIKKDTASHTAKLKEAVSSLAILGEGLPSITKNVEAAYTHAQKSINVINKKGKG